MANLRISEFDANTTLNGTEVVLGVQAGNTTKILVDDIKTFTNGGNILSDHIAVNQVLTDVGLSYLYLPLIEENTDYVIDGLLTFINTNTDGLRVSFSQGEDLTFANVRITTDLVSSVVNISAAEANFADASGITAVRIMGFIKAGVGAVDVGISLNTITNSIGTTTLTRGSYLTATKI